MTKIDIQGFSGCTAKLNEHLANHSYVNGNTATQDDLTVFESFTTEPDVSFPHALRWFRHISALRVAEPLRKWPAATGEVSDKHAQRAAKKEAKLERKENAGAQKIVKEEKKVEKKPKVAKAPPEIVCKPDGCTDTTLLRDPSQVNLGAGVKAPANSPKTETYYNTTAIIYTNGNPHIGHAYEIVCSDVASRYNRMYGRDVFFQTGSDEHGQKIATAAEEQNLAPIELCNKYVNNTKVMYQRLLVSEDHFVRTTDPKHEETARKLWEMCGKTVGDIYLDSYTGWYNVREEAFVADAEAEANNFKDPASGLPLKKMSETSYFFKMSKYQDRLVKLIKETPFIQPMNYRNQILSRLEEPLRDLCISRTTFDWGVRVPDEYDQKHVMYVWFDALSNYLSGIDALNPAAPNARFWPANHHVIGKDIVWFHSVIWPCMLMSANVPLPKSIMVHGFLVDANGDKMSKSLGNVVDCHEVLNYTPADSLRWYMMRAAVYGSDIKFSIKGMKMMHNSDLLENLGNLVNRGVNLCQKYTGGKVPDIQIPADEPLPFDVEALRVEVDEAMKNLDMCTAARKIISASSAANGWLTAAEPWKLKDDQAERRTIILRLLLDTLYILAHFFTAYCPVAAQAIFDKLQTEPCAIPLLRTDFQNLAVGTPISVGPVLFGLFEIEEEVKKEAAPKPAKVAAKKVVDDRAIDDVTRLDIRVGKIVECWAHPEAEKLWCEKIDIGEAEPRTIASGLRAHYTQEQMVGSDVLVLCNLKARKMKGFESQGMVLCANAADGKVEFVTPPAGAKIGEQVTFEGFEGVPDEKLSEKKGKEAWPAIMPGLRTDESDPPVATYKGVPFKLSTGVATCKSAKDAQVS